MRFRVLSACLCLPIALIAPQDSFPGDCWVTPWECATRSAMSTADLAPRLCAAGRLLLLAGWCDRGRD